MQMITEAPVLPAPTIRPTVVLTPRGEAVVALQRLQERLEALSADDLAYVAPLLVDALVDVQRRY